MYYCYRQHQLDTTSIGKLRRFGSFLQQFDRLSIEEMCQLVAIYLQALKMALNESSLIYFIGKINENDPREFSTHLQLLSHIQEELLPIFSALVSNFQFISLPT